MSSLLCMLCFGVLAGLAYAGSAYLWGLSGAAIWKGRPATRKVALTFDDGPDPRFTSRCIEVLKEHDVRATFFLIGEKVRSHPQLVRDLLAAGHELGNHTLRHRHHWLLTPGRARDEVAQGATALEEVAGHPATLFRPPWGEMNPFTLWAARKLRQRCILWSVRSKDWKAGWTPEGLAQRVLSAVHPGAIVLMHDSGPSSSAVETMLKALPIIIREVKSRGCTCVTIGELLSASE